MKYAVIIPIHSKKINWLNLCLSSLVSAGGGEFDIVLLVSNFAEEVVIARALDFIFKGKIQGVRFLNIESYITIRLCNESLLKRYQANQERCIVNLKKFLGLHWAKDFYDFILCVDCDIVFLHNTHVIFKRALQNYHQNLYFAGFRSNPSIFGDILQACASFFEGLNILGSQRREVLKSITQDFTSYPWFFDIPAYASRDLVEFFDAMGNFWERITWHSFEHIIFVYWRLLMRDAKLISYTQELGITAGTEELSIEEISNIQMRYGYLPLWISYRRLLMADCSLCFEIPIAFHADRI